MHYARRLQENALNQFLTDPDEMRNVLLVEGAGRIGKTTLVEQVLADQGLPVITLNLELHCRVRSRIDSREEFDDSAGVTERCGLGHPWAYLR